MPFWLEVVLCLACYVTFVLVGFFAGVTLSPPSGLLLGGLGVTLVMRYIRTHTPPTEVWKANLVVGTLTFFIGVLVGGIFRLA